MKICFMGDGNSIHIKRWLNYFVSRGHETHLITFSKVDLENVKVHVPGGFEINPKGGNYKYLLYISKIKDILSSIKPDIISAHYITSYGFLAAATGFPAVALTAWGSDVLVTAKKNLLYKALTSFALRKARLVTTESKYLSSEVAKLSNVKVITVPMGIEKSICELERKEINEEYRILSLRTVSKNSNIDVIVRAFSKVIQKNKDKNLKLIITNDGTEMEEIKKIIKEFQLEPFVETMGFVSREKLIELMLSSQIHISIPASDSTSVTLLEAMACGIFNIVSNIPSNREWIEDGVNGLLLKDMDENALAECIEHAFNDMELNKKSALINKELILQKAIWEDNMGEVEKEFEKLIRKQ